MSVKHTKYCMATCSLRSPLRINACMDQIHVSSNVHGDKMGGTYGNQLLPTFLNSSMRQLFSFTNSVCIRPHIQLYAYHNNQGQANRQLVPHPRVH